MQPDFHRGLLTLAVVSLALLATERVPRSSAPADSDWPLTIEPLPSPAADSSSAPQLTTEGDRAIVSWMERAVPRTLFKFSERTAAAWSAPATVAAGNDLVVNAADVPSVRALGNGTLAAAWMLANSPDPEAYDLRLAFSRDRGATWTTPVSPHHDRTETQHGFATLFQAPGAGLGLVWLDGRATNPKLAQPGDNMSLRAAVFSQAGRQLREMPIDSRVCDCCPTSVAITSEGPIVAFRNRSEKEVRDIYVSRLAAGRWTTPVPVHADGWQIDACPVNGPSTSARNRDVVVAWFAALNNQGKAYLAFSRDAGRTFGTPVRVDDESAIGHVDVELLKDGSAAVSWIEFAKERSQFKVRRIDSTGGRSTAVTIAGAGDARVAGHPRLALVRDELLFAWTETMGGASHVRTARAAVR
jgi:hypothetical protein